MQHRGPQLQGIRGRLTALSVALVALALAAGVSVFANLLNRVLVAQLEASVQSEARIVADVVAEEGPAVVGLDTFTHLFRVQLLDSAGNVIYSSSREPSPVSALRPGPGVVQGQPGDAWWWPGGDPENDVVGAAGTAFAGEDYVVLVATSQDQPHRTVTTTAGVMLGSSPLLLLAAGGLAWWLVGRVLRPVEDIRARVETLTATNLADRVPVPDSRDEVAALASTMNGMLGRLEAARDAQLRFVWDASHELRSPLTAITGALELMDDDPAAHTGQVGELLPLVRAETERLEGIVQGLLLLSRGDGQPAIAPRTDVDLDDLASAEVTRLRATTTLRIESTLSPARTTGDQDALARVLRNLCDNAVRHAASTVRVTTTPDGRLVVEDDGNGIPERDRERVFDRFVRLDESRSRDAGGSGLGLAIVRQVVLAHGGTVTVDASPTLGGARFTVRLPPP